MQIPSYLLRPKSLIIDEDTGLITYDTEDQQEWNPNNYITLNNAVKRVVKLPRFGMLAVDMTEDFRRRNTNNQFPNQYPLDNSRSAYGLYKKGYYNNAARSANPTPAYYIVLPNDVRDLVVIECPIAEQSIYPVNENIIQAYTIDDEYNPSAQEPTHPLDRIDMNIVDSMKSDSAIFELEDERRSELLMRFEEDPAQVTPSDQSWHYDPCNLGSATKSSMQDDITQSNDSITPNEIRGEEVSKTFDDPSAQIQITTRKQYTQDDLVEWINKRQYHNDQARLCSSKIHTIKVSLKKRQSK